MYSYGSPHTAAQKQDDQHERTFSSYVRIQVVVLKTCLGRWTIGRSGERGSGISVLPARYDDDDDDIYIYIFTNLISTSIHGTRKKQKKNPGLEQEKKVSQITAQGEKKKFWVKKKEKANLVRPLEKKSRDTQSVVKRKPKKPSANPAMLQLLKCSTPDNGAKYKINLNRESKIFY